MEETKPSPLELNICSCCLSENCYHNMKTQYAWMEQEEVYEKMLFFTFNIAIKPKPILQPLICEECIPRLRDAFNFRKQVLKSKEKLVELLNGTIDETENQKEETKFTVIISQETKSQDTISSKTKLPPTKIITVKQKNNFEEAKSLKNKLLHTKPVSCRIKMVTADKTPPRKDRQIKIKSNTVNLLRHTNITLFRWQKNKYGCFCCKDLYGKVEDLRKHMSSHKFEEIEKKILFGHSIVYHKAEISNLKCKLCKNSQDYLNLKQHFHTVHNLLFEEDLLIPFRLEKEIQCGICMESFSAFHTLNIHMNVHYNNHTCDICGQGFISNSRLRIHIKSHKKKIYNCLKCNLNFLSEHQKNIHSVKVHKNVLKRKCSYCPERFKNHYSRLKHMIEKHSFKKPEYKCPLCERVFLRQFMVNSHVRKFHMKERNYECYKCGQKFYNLYDMNQHIATHSGSKNFICNVCGKAYVRKWSLKDHLKNHHDVKNK